VQKRRSGRVTKRTKYTEVLADTAQGTATSDDDVLPRRSNKKTTYDEDSQLDGDISLAAEQPAVLPTLIDETQMTVEKILASRKRPRPGEEKHQHKTIGEDETKEQGRKESLEKESDDNDDRPDEYYVKFKNL
jgi:hypothetical protein